MVHVTSATSGRDLGYSDATAAKPFSVRELLRRMLDAMIDARRRQVDRDISRFLRNNGGKLTDDIEREIDRRFLSTF
jgi:hypothetical protein